MYWPYADGVELLTRQARELSPLPIASGTISQPLEYRMNRPVTKDPLFGTFASISAHRMLGDLVSYGHSLAVLGAARKDFLC